MTDDEYQRIKDAEKQRLKAKRTLKRLRQALREQQASGQHAVARMTERVRALFEEHRSAVDALQWDTAHLQARLDALRDTLTGSASSADTGEADVGNVDSELAGSADALDDEALRRHRAEQLVDDLRTQLDADAAPLPDDTVSDDTVPNDDAPGDKASNDNAPDDGLPEKTIGRVPRS